ncbi:MAG: hypothetical protein LBM02_06590 [Lachnospiraceae bacterium]|jgi:hypothetical protein|nr:hypothetical protein [Lachnospiraceae bacterium]
MKNIVFFFIFFLPSLFLYSQNGPIDLGGGTLVLVPLDTNAIYDDWVDYRIKAKIVEECKCNYDFNYLLNLYEKRPGIIPMKFVKMEIKQRVKDFAKDSMSVSDSLLFSIKYLMLPLDTILPLDTTITLLVTRGHSYDYLILARSINDTTDVLPNPNLIRCDDCYAGLDRYGIEATPFFEWLWKHKIIKPRSKMINWKIFRRKTQNAKNIEHCLKELKKKH